MLLISIHLQFLCSIFHSVVWHVGHKQHLVCENPALIPKFFFRETIEESMWTSYDHENYPVKENSQ